MLKVEQLKDVVHSGGLTIRDRLLLCLAADNLNAKTAAQIREIGREVGLTKKQLQYAPNNLSSAKGLAFSTANGWELTKKGQARVTELAGPAALAPTLKMSSPLRSLLPKISNADTLAFVEEAIKCYEAGLLRAAVVLSWAGAVSVLYDHILAKELAAFNVEALKRDTKWKNAKTRDDLARMKEYDFLQVLAAISVIGKNIKDQLEGCLKLRNGCGHPNSLKIGDARVAAHLEDLTLNVFAVFV